MNKTKKSSYQLFSSILTALFLTASIHAPSSYAIISDVDVPQISCNVNADSTCFSLETVFSNIVMVVGTLFGFAFFVMMMWGGMRYLLSGGDPKALQGAKGTITWAIIGLALLALSYTILLIIKAFTGVDVTRFKIGV